MWPYCHAWCILTQSSTFRTYWVMLSAYNVMLQLVLLCSASGLRATNRAARTILAPEDSRIAKPHDSAPIAGSYPLRSMPCKYQISSDISRFREPQLCIRTTGYLGSVPTPRPTATRSCVPVATIQYSRSISWLFRDSHHASTRRRASIRTMPSPSLLGMDMPRSFYLRQVRANDLRLYCATSCGTRVGCISHQYTTLHSTMKPSPMSSPPAMKSTVQSPYEA